jgi:hypothetical protein
MQMQEMVIKERTQTLAQAHGALAPALIARTPSAMTT